MSTVIGLMDGKDIYIGADSRASTDDGDIRPVICKKFFKNGPFTIAYVGSVRSGQILMPNFFSPPKNIMDLPDAIKEQCEEKGCLCLGPNQESLMACNYLVVYRKKLYEILIDFQLAEIPSYAAVGCGSSYALGSLYTTENIDMSPEDRITIALKASATFSASTGPPFVVEKV
jgi:ATP-dependent protease HslVU (ClpYQ) peptidase subunit